MRVALVSFEFGEYCVRLASGMAPNARTLLLLPEDEAEPHRAKCDPRVHLVTFHRPRYREPLKQLVMLSSILHYITAFQPDVIHFQAGHLWFNFTLPLLRRYPLVITIHDVTHHIGDWDTFVTFAPVMNAGYRIADKVIVHAEQLRQDVFQLFRFPPEKVFVVPHILLRDETPVHVHPAPDDEPRILFFGRIWPYKGLDYLIRAEPQITERLPGVRIVIAGKGEDFDRYRAMMVHPEHFIVYNEYVSNEQRAELFQQASVVVLPYIEASQSGVIPLAYSAAKPVVATRVGGIPEIVDDGQTGYLVAPGDAQALADAILRLLTNPERCREFGRNGEHKLLKECSPEAVAQKTLVVYEHAIAHARPRQPKHDR
ncbi:MAG: glycosyltransferase family 4 protein [Chloroflexaceae bacterium]|nr:glycosyltransferase family 4 protein [Chloroflexaceae bacterium]